MKIIKILSINAILFSHISMAAEEPLAELRLIRDSHTNETLLLAVITASKEADLRIQGIKLFDPAYNIDVTRVSDGQVLSNYAGGFGHAPYMKDFLIPKGVDDVSLVIPFPRSKALMREHRVPGEYLFKLRHFAGEPLRVRILEDGSLVPSKKQNAKALQKPLKVEKPATRPESKSDNGDKPQTKQEPGSN